MRLLPGELAQLRVVRALGRELSPDAARLAGEAHLLERHRVHHPVADRCTLGGAQLLALRLLLGRHRLWAASHADRGPPEARRPRPRCLDPRACDDPPPPRLSPHPPPARVLHPAPPPAAGPPFHFPP